MTHYVCEGSCGGVAEEQKNCGAEDCDKHDEPLTPCDCDDGKHGKSCGSGCCCGH